MRVRMGGEGGGGHRDCRTELDALSDKVPKHDLKHRTRKLLISIQTEHNLQDLHVTHIQAYTILGVPYHSSSTIYPKTLF